MVYTSNTSTDNLTTDTKIHFHGLRPPSGLQLVGAELASLVFQCFSVLASSGVFQLEVYSFLGIFVMGYFKFFDKRY